MYVEDFALYNVFYLQYAMYRCAWAYVRCIFLNVDIFLALKVLYAYLLNVCSYRSRRETSRHSRDAARVISRRAAMGAMGAHARGRRARVGARCSRACPSTLACASSACVGALVALALLWCGTSERAERASGARAHDGTTSASVRAEDVCLFSPASFERLTKTLPRLASTWRGAISIAVVVDIAAEPRRALELAQIARDVEGNRARVVITVVEALGEFNRPGEPRFPVNMLRNVAREACVERLGANFVLMHDIDFEIFPDAPSDDLLRDIADILQPDHPRRALVVPAFQLHSLFAQRLNAKRDAIINARKSSMRSDADIDAIIDRHVTEHGSVSSSSHSMALCESFVERDAHKTSMPARRSLNLTLPYSTKERLKRLVHERRLADGFQLNYFPIAHRPSNYTRWFANESNAPYRVATHKHPYYYEPYLILRADAALQFDESFVTYGFNKISYAHELSAAGFEFYVTKNAWTVHTNVHASRAMENSVGKDLERCQKHPARSNDHRIARIGHSCIPAFIRRLKCAYGFTLNDVEFNGDPSAPPPSDLMFRLASDENIVCFAGCVTDLEDAPRTPSSVIIRGGRFVDVTQGSHARRRKRGLCERFDAHLVGEE